MQNLYVNGKVLKVIRSFSIGFNKPMVLETEAGFCYLAGNLVTDRAHLNSIPSPHKERAMEWFDKTYGEKVKKGTSDVNLLQDLPTVAEQEKVDEGITEIPGLREEIEALE